MRTDSHPVCVGPSRCGHRGRSRPPTPGDSSTSDTTRSDPELQRGGLPFWKRGTGSSRGVRDLSSPLPSKTAFPPHPVHMNLDIVDDRVRLDGIPGTRTSGTTQVCGGRTPPGRGAWLCAYRADTVPDLSTGTPSSTSTRPWGPLSMYPRKRTSSSSETRIFRRRRLRVSGRATCQYDDPPGAGPGGNRSPRTPRAGRGAGSRSSARRPRRASTRTHVPCVRGSPTVCYTTGGPGLDEAFGVGSSPGRRRRGLHSAVDATVSSRDTLTPGAHRTCRGPDDPTGGVRTSHTTLGRGRTCGPRTSPSPVGRAPDVRPSVGKRSSGPGPD